MRSLQQSHRPQRLLHGLDGRPGVRMQLRATSRVSVRRGEESEVQRQRSCRQSCVQERLLATRRLLGRSRRRTSHGERFITDKLLRAISDVRAQHRGQAICTIRAANDADAVYAGLVGSQQRKSSRRRVRDVPGRAPAFIGRQKARVKSARWFTHPRSAGSEALRTPVLCSFIDGSRTPQPMARAPTRVRSSSLAQPMASAPPGVVSVLNWKAAASRRPSVLATRKQPGSRLPSGIHGCALWQLRMRGGSAAPSQCSHDSSGACARRESKSSMRAPVAAPNMKELPAVSAEHSAVKHSAVGRPPAITCTTRGVLGGGERVSASHMVADEAHSNVQGWAPKMQARQPSGAPSAIQTCAPGLGARVEQTTNASTLTRAVRTAQLGGTSAHAASG